MPDLRVTNQGNSKPLSTQSTSTQRVLTSASPTKVTASRCQYDRRATQRVLTSAPPTKAAASRCRWRGEGSWKPTHSFLCSAFLSVSPSRTFLVTGPPLRAFRREPSARLRLVRFRPAFASSITGQPSPAPDPSAPLQGSLRQLQIHRSTAFASFIAGQPSSVLSLLQDSLRQLYLYHRTAFASFIARQPSPAPL